MTGATIYIYSGKVHSGKTSRLSEWIKEQPNTCGILSPLIERKRFILHIKSSETRLLEADPSSSQKEMISVGRHLFSAATFAWARQVLYSCAKENPQWLIIDEIGHLELFGSGLEPAVSEILHSSRYQIKNILLIVRENLLARVIDHFSLDKKEVRCFKLARE